MFLLSIDFLTRKGQFTFGQNSKRNEIGPASWNSACYSKSSNLHRMSEESHLLSQIQTNKTVVLGNSSGDGCLYTEVEILLLNHSGPKTSFQVTGIAFVLS